MHRIFCFLWAWITIINMRHNVDLINRISAKQPFLSMKHRLGRVKYSWNRSNPVETVLHYLPALQLTGCVWQVLRLIPHEYLGSNRPVSDKKLSFAIDRQFCHFEPKGEISMSAYYHRTGALTTCDIDKKDRVCHVSPGPCLLEWLRRQ
jgi:hypothetical protein